jgi:hypothetical protein
MQYFINKRRLLGMGFLSHMLLFLGGIPQAKLQRPLHPSPVVSKKEKRKNYRSTLKVRLALRFKSNYKK